MDLLLPLPFQVEPASSALATRGSARYLPAASSAAYRLQEAGWRGIDEYVMAHGHPATWSESGYYASLRMKMKMGASPSASAADWGGKGAGAAGLSSSASESKSVSGSAAEGGTLGAGRVGSNAGEGLGGGSVALFVYYTSGRECEDKYVSRVKVFTY